jgi:hypothetical protein
MSDWHLQGKIAGTPILPITVTATGQDLVLVPRLVRERGEGEPPPTVSLDDLFRARVHERLQEHPAVKRDAELQAELVSARKRRTFHSSQKVESLEQERAELVARAPRGFAAKVAILDDKLTAPKQELARLEREVAVLESVVAEHDAELQSVLRQEVETTCRAIYTQVKAEHDQAMVITNGTLHLDAVLQAHLRLLAASKLVDHRVGQLATAKEILDGILAGK